MPSEPSWSKKVSSSTVCTWFYAIAIVNLLFGTAGIVSALFLMSKGKYDMLQLVTVVLAATVGFANSWGFFLVCNRGINA
jgi:hypothetical protein